MSNLQTCKLCDNDVVIESFCIECDEYFCESCTNIHGKFPLLSAHCVIPSEAFSTFPKDLIRQAVKCSAHQEHSKEYYCIIHCESFCFSCFIETHRCCNSNRINRISKDIRFSDRFTELQKRIEEEFESAKEAIQNHLIASQDLVKQKNTIEVQLKAFTEEVNNNLNKLTHQINHLYKEQSEKLDTELQELRIIEKTLFNQQLYLSHISKYCSEDTVFLCLNEIDKLLQTGEEKMQRINNNFKHTSLEVTGINTLNDLKYKIEKMKVYLNVKSVKFESSKRSLAQLTLRPVTDKCDAIIPLFKLKYQINLSDMGIKAPSINDCTTCQDGDIVVLEQRHMSILEFTQAGKLTRNEKIFFKPLCITAVGQDTFAFTVENNDRVQIFSKPSMSSKEIVSVPDNCSGICRLSENMFIVACSFAGLVAISTDGERQQVYNTKELMYLKHKIFLTASKNGQIFCSLPVQNTIVAIDSNGKFRFQFLNKKLQNPRGITLDSNNNILVAGYYSDNIIWISNDGKRFKEILTKKDGIENPRGIDYNKDMGILVVCNNNGRRLSIYEI